MTSPEGAFYSATDADSEGEEGLFFVWTPAQIRDALGADADFAMQLFGVTEAGNFEGKNVLSLRAVPSDDERAFLRRVRPKLYEARARRPPPLTDTKVLTAWNGLMISAFARAGLAFGRQDYVDRAARAAEQFPLSDLRRTGRHAALLEDHAFLAAGFLDVYEASGDARWLRGAVDLHRALAERFADPQGGFFRTPAQHETLLAREKPSYDGAEPTGNSVAALTLLRLAEITGDAAYRRQAEALLKSFGALLAGAPAALGEMLLAVDFLLSDAREVVLVRPRGGSDEALLEVVRGKFAPSQVLVRHEDGAPPATPLAQDRPPREGSATAYVCVHGACQLPVTAPAGLEKLLG